jgi:4-hydroxy-4-methyl-2-oxoglutarate aldolase
MSGVDATAAALGALGTTTVSDALDRLGVDGHVLGIGPLDQSFSLAGRAYTILMAPVGERHGTVGDYVDDVEVGSVVVLDNRGRLDATVWGDLLTIVAHRRGLAGTVIDGVCRDTPRSIELGYPIFSRGTYMRTGKDRVQADAYQVPVSLGQVRVEPGDVLVGDADGVVVVPLGRDAEVLAVAREIDAAEERIRAAVQGGARLDEARGQVGYHQLQARDDR